MNALKRIFLLVALIGYVAFAGAQEAQQDKEQNQNQQPTPETATIMRTFENVTQSEVTKKEKDISNLIEQLNEKNKQLLISGGKAKKALQEEFDQLKQQLRQEMKEYSLMIDSYNRKLAKEIPSVPDSSASSPAPMTETDIRNKQAELLEIVDVINNKIHELNRETSDAVRTTLSGEIEMLQNDFLAKKARFIKLVNEYNARLKEKLQLND